MNPCTTDFPIAVVRKLLCGNLLKCLLKAQPNTDNDVCLGQDGGLPAPSRLAAPATLASPGGATYASLRLSTPHFVPCSRAFRRLGMNKQPAPPSSGVGAVTDLMVLKAASIVERHLADAEEALHTPHECRRHDRTEQEDAILTTCLQSARMIPRTFS